MTDRSEKHSDGGTWLEAAGVGAAGDLEELRRCMVRHLDSLEALALRCGSSTDPDAARLEQEVNRSIELTAQLEADRQLLAAAWERLESERLEATVHRAAVTAPAAAARGRRTEPAPTPERHTQPELSRASASNPVAESILRQFQTLCGDVRRNNNARVSSR